MPRKPKQEPTKITVSIDGTPTALTLFPPNGSHSSWYVYWHGLPHSRSTGASDMQDAIVAAESMFRNGGSRPVPIDDLMSDEEFREIQRNYYDRKTSLDAKKRSAKSLGVCLDAINAFQQITGVKPICLATPDDCAKFQRDAQKLPKSWRLKYPRARKTGVLALSPNTVLKWSTALSAAFERANITAGRKCVRGVVPESKLLKANPWRQFTWIEGNDKPKRQFTEEELISILDYFESEWQGVTAVTAAIKTSLWAWARLSEMAGLKWSDLRVVGHEQHFQIIGKWGVEKWARLPAGLMSELLAMRIKSDHVFAAYSKQLRVHHRKTGQDRFADLVNDRFSSDAFASWFHSRIKEWAEKTGNVWASPHTFRKTALQHARRGEDVNRQVAQDAKLSESVMMNHYVNERDEELRQSSNRTYGRIMLSLSVEVAARYGYQSDDEGAELKRRLTNAVNLGEWELAQKLAAELSNRNGRNGEST